MGTDIADTVEILPYPGSFKVHHLLCTKLGKLVGIISRIVPEIEAARPCWESGMHELCLLRTATEKAKLLLQHCSESSKLYLAITGDVVISRCQKSIKSMEQSLGKLQNMVPVMLSAEISRILDDIRDANFNLDSSEEAAGKMMKNLLRPGACASDSLENSEIKTLQFAASRLHITTSKALLIETRSIRKLLDKIGESESDKTKKKILKYLLYLLKKYGNSIIIGQTEKAFAQPEESFTLEDVSSSSVYNQSVVTESCTGYGNDEAQTAVLSRAVPPEEFKCPISLRLMYDPVVIASGQTFERMWIQKWFSEGNDTCPITKMKLAHLSLTPNTVMKDLISKWCMKCGITIPDPSMKQEALQPWETSFTSIASLSSSMNDLRLPIDLSNVSLGSLDTSYTSDSSQGRITDGLSSMMQTNGNSHRYQSNANMPETDSRFLSNLAELQWEAQRKLVDNVKNHLKYNDHACRSLSSENFVEPLIKFLRDAADQHDEKAQRTGSQLLLEFVNKSRSGILYLHEDAFSLLASFLNSEVTGDALSIMAVLSAHQHCKSKIVASGALTSILNILDSQIRDFQELAHTILYNLSSNRDICSYIVSLECIPKLIPFLDDTHFAGNCILILENLCITEEARVSVAETDGCIASVAQLLEIGSCEDQEHAVAVLLSLCSQCEQYCNLVMDEGVIPNLVSVSINGNDKGKVLAFELLRILRDIKYDDEQKCAESDFDTSKDSSNQFKEKKSHSKGSLLGKLFSKSSALAPKKKK